MRQNIVLSVGLIVFTLLVFSPSEVYFRNALQFQTTALEFFLTGLPIAALMTVVGVLVCLATVGKLKVPLHGRFLALLMSVGFAFVLQGTYMGWSFGAIDGSAIDWSQPFRAKVSGISLWAVPLLLPQVFKALRTPEFIRAVCSILLVTQTTLVAWNLVKYDDFKDLKQYSASHETRFEFSSDRNAIVLVLDEFQCDIFSELIEEDADLAGRFDGFTFFKNAVAAASQTFPSVPAMLTGVNYNNAKPIPVYLEQAYLAKSLPGLLHDNGVISEMYPSIPNTVFMSPEVASNAVERVYSIGPYFELLKYGFARSLPYNLKPLVGRADRALKKYIRQDEDQGVRADPWSLLSFNTELDLATVSRDKTTFKFIHLEGVHVPIMYDDRLNIVDIQYGRESVKQQAMGALGLITKYLEKLKNLGIYDRSVIVIVGDHGSGRSQDMWLQAGDATDDTFNRFKARGCPLILAKPLSKAPGMAPESLRISSAPVSLIDVPATILSELNIQERKVGQTSENAKANETAFEPTMAMSLFSVEEDAERIRVYYGYRWKEHRARYLAPITEYIIDGDVWKDGSWTVGSTFEAP